MRPKKSLITILSFTIVVLGGMSGAVPALACTCAEASAAEKYENATTIFSGSVKNISTNGSSRSVDFIVDQFFKGGTGENITVTTGLGDADCGFDFEINKSYKVYAHGNNQLSTNICSGIMRLEEVTIPQDIPITSSNNLKRENPRSNTARQVITALIGFSAGVATTYFVLKRRTR